MKNFVTTLLPAERALKELGSSRKCPLCGLEYEKSDLIRINPIHPDHKKSSRELFEKRRKKAEMKLKLARKMKKVSFHDF